MKKLARDNSLDIYSATMVFVCAVVLGVEAYTANGTHIPGLIVIDWILLAGMVVEVFWRFTTDPLSKRPNLEGRRTTQNDVTIEREARFLHRGMFILDILIIVGFFFSLVVGVHLQEFALLRVPRILLIVHVLDIKPLREFTAAIMHSFWNVAKAAIVVMVHFYVYAVIGTFLFRDNNAENFGDLGKTSITLMHVNTGVGYQKVLDSMSGIDNSLGIAYFASYVFIGITLLIGIVTAMITNDILELRQNSKRIVT